MTESMFSSRFHKGVVLGCMTVAIVYLILAFVSGQIVGHPEPELTMLSGVIVGLYVFTPLVAIFNLGVFLVLALRRRWRPAALSLGTSVLSALIWFIASILDHMTIGMLNV